MKHLFIIIILLTSASQAFAYGSYRASSYSSFGDGGNGVRIGVNGMYYFTTEGGNPPNTANTTITRQLIEAMLGYHFNLFYIGGRYSYDAIVTAPTGGTTTTDSFRAWGGDIGLTTENVYLLFTYFFSSIGTVRGGSAPGNPVDFSGGTGYQITLGYNFDLGSGFGIGPALAYKSLSYSNFASGAATSFTYTTLVPQANIRYNF